MSENLTISQSEREPRGGDRIGALDAARGRARDDAARPLPRLAARRRAGVDLAGYDELWRWSVTDLEGFWGSLWDFFGVRAHTPYERVLGSREMPGAEWFTGARLNYAEHMLGARRGPRRGRGRWRARRRATPSSSPSASCASRWRARGRACSGSGSGRGDRVVAYLPNIPETLVAFLATASLGAVWATCAPEFGAAQRDRPLRPARAEGAARRSPATATARSRRPPRRGCRDPRRAADARARRPRPVHRRRGRLAARRRRAGTSSSPRAGRSSSTRCRSTTRSTCSSRRARRGCRRRSCTATAASWSSTSRTTA